MVRIFINTLFLSVMMISAAHALVADPREMQKQCVTAGDCVIKDAGSCCGYNPACFNKDAVIDLEAVKKQCEKNEVAGICGFAEISACECNQGWCVPVHKPITNDTPQ